MHGEEAKFAIVAGAALIVTVVLPFTGVWYVDIATVSLSAICAIALALFRVRFWVRLITMPLAMLAAFILVMSACDRWLDGTSTSWGDPDYDARYFGSQLLMKCPMFGRVARTQEGQSAKADCPISRAKRAAKQALCGVRLIYLQPANFGKLLRSPRPVVVSFSFRAAAPRNSTACQPLVCGSFGVLLCDAHHGVHELHERPKERRCRITPCGESGVFQPPDRRVECFVARESVLRDREDGFPGHAPACAPLRGGLRPGSLRSYASTVHA